jgi:HEAT repeat protein
MKCRHGLGVGFVLGLVLLASASPSRAQATQYLGKTAAAWANDLGSNDAVARRSAAFALGKLGKEAGGTLPRLLLLLRKDEAPSVRQAAAAAVGEMCKAGIKAGRLETCLTPLQEALTKDPDPLVRRSAAVALGSLEGDGAERAKGVLEQALTDTSPDVRQNAAWALGQLGTDSTAALKKAMADPDRLVVREAAKALGLIGPSAHAALPELLASCRHADVEVRKAALASLVGLVGPDDKGACKPLRQVLKDPDVEVRRNAALALGNIGGSEAADAVPILVEALLQKSDPELRGQAAAVLRNVGPPAVAALDPLRKALKDPDPQLRANAALGLGGLGTAAEPAFGDLLSLLTNSKEDSVARTHAAVTLSQIAKVAAAEKAIPTLIAVVREQANPARVRERTLWALTVHGKDLESHADLFTVLDRILTEPRTPENKMLRYDSAFLLGMFKGAEVSEKALDELLEFLKDESIRKFKGIKVNQGPTGPERKRMRKDAKDVGEGDGRYMAVRALVRVGRERLRYRRDILDQLRRLWRDPGLMPDLRKELEGASGPLGL